MSLIDRITHRLGQLGYALGKGLTDAVRDAQARAGLEPTGELDSATIRAIEAPRFCGLPDVMPLAAEINRWPNPKIYWGFAEKWPVDMATVQAAIEWACRQWELVCGVEFIYCDQSFPPESQSRMLIECKRIDGPGGTLAWSELANNKSGQKTQRYDAGESAWVNSESPRQFEIDLARVACHEIGHFIGIPHIRAGNLLQPTYDVRIRTPQAGDIQEAQSRYGPPKKVTPPPADPPPSPANVTIQISGSVSGISIPGYRVTKVQ